MNDEMLKEAYIYGATVALTEAGYSAEMAKTAAVQVMQNKLAEKEKEFPPVPAPRPKKPKLPRYPGERPGPEAPPKPPTVGPPTAPKPLEPPKPPDLPTRQPQWISRQDQEVQGR